LCGIAGWVGKKGDSNSTERKTRIINKVLDDQVYRGPDGRGIWKDSADNAVIGHNRLSILDLSEAGSQPMMSKDSRWVISYNGELYNYNSLRDSLRTKYGVSFKGNSDTEVFLYGLVHFGVDEFLRIADGMFAAAVYDKKNKEIFLLRDKVGEKPLYYTRNSEGLFFASELKSLAKNVVNSVNASHSGLQLYTLLRYVPAPFTMLESFYKLKAGHYIRFKIGSEKVQQIPYFSWDPNASEIPPTNANYNEVVKATEALLVKSLESRLMSDVPLGFFLSGGIDSTLCAALIRKYLGKEINSYSIGFEGDSSSEHGIAEKTASIIGAKHSTEMLKKSELFEHSIGYIKNLDEPNGDRSCVPMYLLCKHARSEVTVALGGDGGDELFSGYSRYPGLNRMLSEGNYFNPFDSLKAYFSERLPVFGFQSTPVFGDLFSDSESFFSSLSTHLYPPANFEQSIRFIDFNSYLPGCVLSKVDRMSMLVSLEVRTPFFSPQLLELASRLPYEFLYRGAEMKPILRDVCRKIGLNHVADLPKKGFGMPAEFLTQDKENLAMRAKNAVGLLNASNAINIEDFGTKLSRYAGSNMNSLWATIVLGEWFANFEDLG
jgi:asparagine synthase (glutamine-hydrolysing)